MATCDADVVVRAADAGDTYLTWTWLDEPEHPYFEVLAAATTDAAIASLDANLFSPVAGESDAERLSRVLVDGAFADRAAELAFAQSLTNTVFPRRLREQIAGRAAANLRVRVRLTPSPRLARVPWELLLVDGDRRLVEIAEIAHDPPSAVHVNRARLPSDWTDVENRPVLYVIDPILPPHARSHGLGRVLDRGDEHGFAVRVGELVSSGRIPRGEQSKAIAYALTRGELGAALREPRSRLLYVGHVSAAREEPGSAAIHVHDTAETWGLATPLRRVGRNGLPIESDEDHRPLSAADLLLGTTLDGSSSGSAEGHELWPMPARVALIACEGGVDYRSAEIFGLVVAMINAGAGLVTTTRWTLPANRVFRRLWKGFSGHPTTELALRVDAAHDSVDPVGELVRWQRRELEAWRTTGDIAHTPLVWASLTSTLAPAREIVRVSGDG